MWCWCIAVAEIFLRPDRPSVSQELIIDLHTAHSLHQGCRGAKAAKSSPYCAYSPHLRSLCCAVHSGPPVQLFLCKKLQNSILQREKNTQTMGEGKETNSIKRQRIQAVNNQYHNYRRAGKKLNGSKLCSPHITCYKRDRIFLAPTVRWCTQLM